MSPGVQSPMSDDKSDDRSWGRCRWAARPGLASADLSTGRAMTKAEVAVIVLGIALIGATVWIPSLSDRTRALLLLLVIAAGILLMLHQLTAS